MIESERGRSIRVLLADDEPAVLLWLRGVLSPSEGFEIAGEACDGAECVAMAAALKPDLVLADLDMPRFGGIEVARRIMQEAPCPVIIFSPSEAAHRRDVLFRATEVGALDVLLKPEAVSSESARPAAQEIRRRVRLMAPIKVVRRRAAGAARPEAAGPAGARAVRLVALAASTGGPDAILRCLRGLSPTVGWPVLVVQHMAEPFIPDFARWLEQGLRLKVFVAEHGAALRPGGLWLAPGDSHMRLGAGGRLLLDKEPPIHSCRPSADALFASVAEQLGGDAVGILLTGMGNDGAAGLLRMRRAGALTLAQDEASSTVFGMPGEAIALGAATHVLAPEEIGGFLQRCL